MSNEATNVPAATTALAKSEPKSIKEWIQSDQFRAAVSESLPSHLTPERFVRVALTAMMKTPKLAQCSQNSLFKAMLDLSSLGLEPDGRRAHLIPFENRKKGIVEVQLIIDYKGLIELAKRSGEVKSWRAEIVCENDVFSWENGVVTHKIDWLKPRGAMLAVYSHVRNQDDVDDYEVMTKDQVEGIRKRSKAGNDGPWVTDFNEMAKKTVMRRHSKRLTLSPEFNDALQKDDDSLEDLTPAYNLEDLMPKRASEVDDVTPLAPEQEPVATTATASATEVKEPIPVPVKTDPAHVSAPAQAPAADPKGPITPKGLETILNALKENPTFTKTNLMSYVKAVYGVERLNELKEEAVAAVVKFIGKPVPSPTPPTALEREPGCDDE